MLPDSPGDEALSEHRIESRGSTAVSTAGEVTELLARCSSGDREAFERLVPLVYEDLHRIAHRRLQSERTDHTLDTTALVHEAYLALVPQATASWADRTHFFAVAARVIRHVLIDHARRRGAHKRGEGRIRVPLAEDLVSIEGTRDTDLVALDDALAELGARDPRLERVVECRFFAGLTVRETAAALGSSVRTVERDWARARAYLYLALADPTVSRDHPRERPPVAGPDPT